MTDWPERLLWCWKCFRSTIHTGRSVYIDVVGVDAPVSARIIVTTIICRRCFNCKRHEAELDHMEMPAKTEEE